MKVSENGFTLKVTQDKNPTNPRERNFNIGKMFCFNPRYLLGDKHEYAKRSDFFEGKEFKDAFVINPIFLKEGKTLELQTEQQAINDNNTRNCVGYIVATKTDVKCKLGIEIDFARADFVRELLNSEVAQYNNYLKGNTFKYEIEDSNHQVLDTHNDVQACSLKDALNIMREWSEDEFRPLFKKMEKSLDKEAEM